MSCDLTRFVNGSLVARVLEPCLGFLNPVARVLEVLQSLPGDSFPGIISFWGFAVIFDFFDFLVTR